MEKRKSWVGMEQYCLRVAYIGLLTLREYLRKWRKWQSNTEAILLQYSVLYDGDLQCNRNRWFIALSDIYIRKKSNGSELRTRSAESLYTVMTLLNLYDD